MSVTCEYSTCENMRVFVNVLLVKRLAMISYESISYIWQVSSLRQKIPGIPLL